MYVTKVCIAISSPIPTGIITVVYLENIVAFLNRHTQSQAFEVMSGNCDFIIILYPGLCKLIVDLLLYNLFSER